MIDNLSKAKAGTTGTLTTAIRDWFIRLCFREKLKVESLNTSLLSVESIEGYFAFVPEDIMDLTTLFHNLRKEVSCSVCSDLFTDPKHLSCLHSFCLKCLKRWHKTCGGGEAIKCPKCQTLSRVPSSGDLKDLPTSFYLNGFIDVLAIKECKKTQVTCGNCDKKSSVASYCFQCCIFYCDECLIGHNIMRDKKGHRVLAVKEFQHKDYEDVLKRPVFCSKERHQKEELKYYCKECETALCQTCVTLNHGGHDLRLIEEEAENKTLEIKSILQSQREGLDAKLNVIVQLDEDCAKVIQQSEIARRDVQRFADGLIKTIQAKMQNIITAVEDQTKKSLECLKAKRNVIQHQINVTESSLDEADKLLKRSTTAEVVTLKNSLAIFHGVDQTEPILHDTGSDQAFVFVENQKMLDIVNGEEIGFLKEGYPTKAGEYLAEGERLKEGTFGMKAERRMDLNTEFEKGRIENINLCHQYLNLYVKNLDDTIDDKCLHENFSAYAAIIKAMVMMDKKGNSKGFGFVAFSSPEEASKAVTEMNGRIVGSKPLYVALAQRKKERRAQLAAQHMQ